MPLLMASPAYRSGHMLIAVTFDEAGSGDASACRGETPGPDNPTPGFSPLDPRYLTPGTVDTTGFYNHYSALRSCEDLLGIRWGGTDGFGHLGFAGAPGLQPFGRDVFNRFHRR
jgi:phosphatidylinositol-3-phosphatase